MEHYILANGHYFITEVEVKSCDGIQVFTSVLDWVKAIQDYANYGYNNFVSDYVSTAIHIHETAKGFNAKIDNQQWIETIAESSKQCTPTVEDFILNFSI